MGCLLIFDFANQTGATQMIADVKSLQEQRLLTIADAATLLHQLDSKVKVRQVNSLVGEGALGGAFWGVLVGLLFMMPWMGLAIGAVTGAVVGKFSDYGIDDRFLKKVGAVIEPGHSALFLVVEKMNEDKVFLQLARHQATVLRTNLSMEEETRLRSAFNAVEA